MAFVADDGPSLETGAVLDAALSGNYCAIADSVSVTTVQEKCDDKEQGVRFGLRVRRTLKAYGRCENAC